MKPQAILLVLGVWVLPLAADTNAPCFQRARVIGYSQVGAARGGWFVQDGVFESIASNNRWELNPLQPGAMRGHSRAKRTEAERRSPRANSQPRVRERSVKTERLKKQITSSKISDTRRNGL